MAVMPPLMRPMKMNTTPLKKYRVDFRVDTQLRPEERALMRRGQRGLWHFGDWVMARNGHHACSIFRAAGYNYKLRSTLEVE